MPLHKRVRQALRTALYAGSLACLVSACGFQLRGAGGLPVPDDWTKMYLATNNPNSEFSRDVKTRFAANGIEWTTKELANYRLILGPEQFSQRNLSLNANARAAEFELSMRAKFFVQDRKGKTVIARGEASVIKQMENDPSNVVGKGEEIRILQDEMRLELAQQIMRRISFYASSLEAQDAGQSEPDAKPQPAPAS